MRGLDGIQGPFHVGTGCIFNRKALYGYFPSLERKGRRLKRKMDGGYDSISTLLRGHNSSLNDMRASSLEIENPPLLLSLKNYFGQSVALIDSIIVKDECFSDSASPEELLKEAIHVIGCEYEHDTAWGREVTKKKISSWSSSIYTVPGPNISYKVWHPLDAVT